MNIFKQKSINVLVCDDDTVFRQTLIDALNIYGFKTYEAGKAYDAVALARSVHVDFGFFDYGLPDMDGASAVRLIRKESIFFPFVIMSGGKTIDSEFGIKAGAVAFLPKPLEICEIRTILQKYFV